MNQPYTHVNQPYASHVSTAWDVQSAMYKNNARGLLSRILSILNLDWLQHAHSVCGVYEYNINNVNWMETNLSGRTKFHLVQD